MSDRLRVARRAAPLGIASVLASFYFTIDLVLLGWLASSEAVGQYGAAVKILTLLVAIPGLVMAAALPGLSMTAESRERFSDLVARVAQWLATVGLPICTGIAVFAPSVVDILFGPEYRDAVPLIRILAGAAAVALAANVLGTVMISLSIVRPQLWANGIALALNVGGNVALVPRYGVEAAAWLTLGTELFVVTWAALVLRGRIVPGVVLRRLVPAALACAALAAAGLALGQWPGLAVPVAVAAFLAVLTLARGWPEEFPIMGRFARPAPGGALP